MDAAPPLASHLTESGTERHIENELKLLRQNEEKGRRRERRG
jgi:hypothetical protein